MAARSVELILHILGDASGAEKATATAAASVGKMRKTISKLTIPALAVVGAIALVGEQSVEAASQAEEAMHGLDAVFGKSAKTVEEWAKSSETSAGLSHAAYAKLATTIGGQLHAMGLPMSQVLADTKSLIQRGADLSAVYGGSASDATLALAAAMRGASKQSAKLGLSLKPQTVNALLAARGQDKLKGSALNAAKAQATMDLIAQQAAGSVGKFAEESKTAGEQSKIAAAKWEDAKAALGKSLLPAVSTATGLLGDMAGVLDENAAVTDKLVIGVGAFAVGILLLNGALKVYDTITRAAAAANALMAGSAIAETVALNAMYIAAGIAAVATGDLAAATAAFDAVDPFTWIVLAVVALVALVVAIVEAYKHSERFRAIVTAAFNAVKVAAVAVAHALSVAWSAVWGAISTGASAVGSAWSVVSSVFGAVRDAIVGVARAVGSGLVAAFNVVKGVVVGVGSALAGVFGPVFAVLTAAARLYFAIVQLGFVAIYTVARLAAQVIMLAFEIVWAYLGIAASAAAKVVTAVFSALAGPISAAANAIASAFRAGFAAIRSAASAVAAFVRGVIAPLAGPARAVASAIASAFRTAFAAVSAAARAVAGPIATAMGAVRTAFEKVGAVAKTVGGAIRSGLGTITGFLDGITSAVQRLIGWLGKIKVPKIHIPGTSSSSKSVTGAATRAPAGLTAGLVAPRLGGLSAGVRSPSVAPLSAGLTIQVFGVLDGADAGRKIRAILRDDDRRRMGVRVAGRTVPA